MRVYQTFFVLFALFMPIAKADEFRFTAFGNQVSLSGKFGSRKLALNGKIMIDDGIVDVEEMLIHSGVPIMIGLTASGGNACDAAPFILSFPKNSPPRLDGPVATCANPTYKVEADRIVFSAPASPYSPGSEWIWTLADGFAEPRSIAFQPQPNGWEAMRTKLINHPADILKYSDLRSQFNELVGIEQANLINIMGPGSGKFYGDTFIGSACKAHDCPSAGVFIAVHGPSKKIYLAWKFENRSIVYRPALADWPRNGFSGLNDWKKTYETKSQPPAKSSLKTLSPL